MTDPDAYYEVVDAAATETVRALLAHPDDPDAGVAALRSATGLLDEQYGSGAVRDLAETLATYVAEALVLLATMQGCEPQELLATWVQDGPPPEIGAS
jgi:hypothetical protein